MKEIRHLSETVNVEAELQDLDLYKMMRVFEKVIDKYEFEKNKPVHEVLQYPYTIDGQKTYILSRLTTSEKGRVSFVEIIEESPEKIVVIYNFLAILELLQLMKITLHIGEGFNNFWVEK